MTDLEAAWAAVHENKPEGWRVGAYGDGAPGRTRAPNSHAVLDYYLEVG